MAYIISPMHLEDILQVVEISHEAFPSECPPLSFNSFKRELDNERAHYLVAREQSDSPICQSYPFLNTHTSTASGRKRTILQRLISKFKASPDRWDINTGEEAASDSCLIVGYSGLWFMADEAHIMSIAVRRSHQHRGVGEPLLTGLIDLAIECNTRVLTLEVRVDNVSAQSLYTKYGFQIVGTRPNYYTEDHKDALIMCTGEIASDSFQKQFQCLKQDYSKKHKIVSKGEDLWSNSGHPGG